MSSLTTMLRRAGLLGDEEVARVEAYSRRQRLAPVVALFEMGLIGETQLVRFVHSKLMVPTVGAEVLLRVPTDVIALVPGELAWRHAVLPVSTDDDGNLTLAMADPTDLRAVEAVTAHTGCYLIRAVAPVSALRDAVLEHHGPPTPGRQGPPTPLELPAVGGRQPIVTDAAEVSTPLSSEAVDLVLPRLAAAEDRDAITLVLLEFLAEGFDRVILFVHAQQQVRGRDGRGRDLVIEAIRQVRIPTSGASVFADVIERPLPSFAPWPTERPIDRAFAQAMGGITGNVLMLPVRLRDRVPVIVFAMGTRHTFDPRSLHRLSEAVSNALERAIFLRKSASP